MNICGLTIVLMFLLLSFTAGTASACPESCLDIAWSWRSCSAVAVRDTTISDRGTGGTAGYDLPHGTYHVTAGGCFCSNYALVEALDEFTLIVDGVEDSVSLVATLEVRCNVSGNGNGYARIEVGGHTDSEYLYEDGAFLLTLPIRCVPGNPFPMLVFVQAGAGEGSGDVDARLAFSGLPSRSVLQSCQGYRQDSGTSVTESSWGRLKAAYR